MRGAIVRLLGHRSPRMPFGDGCRLYPARQLRELHRPTQHVRGARVDELQHLDREPHVAPREHVPRKLRGERRRIIAPIGDSAKQPLGRASGLVAGLVTGDQDMPNGATRCQPAPH